MRHKMSGQDKTNEELLEELAKLRQRIAALEASETKYQRTIDAWRDLWAQYDAILEAFDGLIYICSKNYEVEFMNQRFIERTGYYPLGQKCYQALHDRDSICPWCVNDRVFRGETVRWEVLSPKDNRWYHVVNTPIRHPDGSMSKMALIVDITERKQAEKALRQSEERYRLLFEEVPVGLYRTTPSGQILDANQAILEMLGYPDKETLMSVSMADIYLDPEDRKRWQDLMAREGVVRDFVTKFRRRDGKAIWVTNSSRAIVDQAGEVLYYEGSLKDITEQKQAEEGLRRTTRALRTLSACNRALLQATAEQAFLQEICQIIVKVGGYRLAWVGYALEDQAKTVHPVAQAGFEEGYLQTVNITWADAERGRGPTGTAIRTGKTCWVNNMLTDPDYRPWREEALRRGYASSLALPLMQAGQALGALNIYAAEPDAFDAQEVELLEELAGAVAYGIGVMRSRPQHELQKK